MDDSGGGEDAFTGDSAVFFVLSLSSSEAVASDPPSSYPYKLRRHRELTVPRRSCYHRRVALRFRGFGNAKTRAPPLSAAGLLMSGLRAPTELKDE